MRSKKSQLRVVLYARVSNDRHEGRSVDDQLTELRLWAAREGHTVVAEMRDDGISASAYARKKVRPAWQQVMDILAGGEVDALAVWELSRTTRDRAAWAALMAACADAEALLIVGGAVRDPSDPDDAFVLDVDTAGNVRESAKTRKRVLRDVESRAARGLPHGALNFGYKIEYDADGTKRRVPDPVTAPIVREMADRLLAGESAAALARELDARGVRGLHGGKLEGGNIVKQVSAPAQAGLRVHRGVLLPDVEMPGPHVLDRGTYDRLTVLFSDPSRMSRRNGSNVKVLTGVARCAECGETVGTSVRTRDKGARRYVIYRCRKNFCLTQRAEHVDKVVEEALFDFFSHPDVLAELTADDPAAATAAEKVVELRAELNRARTLHRERKLSLDSLVAMEAWALPELAEAEAAAKPRHVPTAVFELEAAEDKTAKWESMPVPVRRKVVASLLTVTIGRPTPGNDFNPDTVDVNRRS